MIIEVSFALVGGLNFGLEKYWETVDSLMKKYPKATWKKIVDRKKKICKYLVEINS